QVGRAKARRWPGLSLGGSIGALRYASAGVDTDMTTWSFGPLALTLPVFDAGQRAALVDAATADYVAAVASYRGKVRQAVREVEEALVVLILAARELGLSQQAEDAERVFKLNYPESRKLLSRLDNESRWWEFWR
ncbi:MAG: RND transporter, partial [Betaproteobacteria bacterium]|nr:RND transporter [Betaproteobacteria bacterium]